jgi:hypothetical protein
MLYVTLRYVMGNVPCSIRTEGVMDPSLDVSGCVVGRKCRPSGEVRRLDASRWMRCGSRYTPERLRLSKLCSEELSIVRVVVVFVSYFLCLSVVNCSFCFVMFK